MKSICQVYMLTKRERRKFVDFGWLLIKKTRKCTKNTQTHFFKKVRPLPPPTPCCFSIDNKLGASLCGLLEYSQIGISVIIGSETATDLHDCWWIREFCTAAKILWNNISYTFVNFLSHSESFPVAKAGCAKHPPLFVKYLQFRVAF